MKDCKHELEVAIEKLQKLSEAIWEADRDAHIAERRIRKAAARLEESGATGDDGRRHKVAYSWLDDAHTSMWDASTKLAEAADLIEMAMERAIDALELVAPEQD